MAFTHRNTQGTTTNAGTTLVITKPTSLAVGDLMVAIITKDDDVVISAYPSGWTEQEQNNTLTGYDLTSWVGFKVADAADVAASNFTWTGDNEDWAGSIAAFIPGNSNPAYVGNSTHIHRAVDATPASNTLATTTDNLLVGVCSSARAGSGGLGVVTAGYTIPTNGVQTTGIGNGDVGSILAYDLAGPGGHHQRGV